MPFRLLLLATGAFVIGTELFVIAGILPDVASGLGVNVPLAGQLVTIFGLAYAIGAPALASLAGRVPRRRLLSFSMYAFAFSNALAALAPNYGWMLAIRVLAALSASLFLPNASALAAVLVTPEKRGSALGLVYAGLSVATVLGVPLGTAVAGAWGWRWVFGGIAVMSLVVATGFRFLLPEMSGVSPISLRKRLALLGRSGVIQVLATTILVLTGAFAVYGYLSPLLFRSIGADRRTIEIFLWEYGMAGVFGSWLGGRAADRWGSGRTLPVVLVLVGSALAALSVPDRSPILIAAIFFVWGAAGGAFTPIQQHRLLALIPDAGPPALALNSSATYLGMTFAGLVGGGTVALGAIQYLGLTGAAFAAIAFVLSFARSRMSRSPT